MTIDMCDHDISAIERDILRMNSFCKRVVEDRRNHHFILRTMERIEDRGWK